MFLCVLHEIHNGGGGGLGVSFLSLSLSLPPSHSLSSLSSLCLFPLSLSLSLSLHLSLFPVLPFSPWLNQGINQSINQSIYSLSSLSSFSLCLFSLNQSQQSLCLSLTGSAGGPAARLQVPGSRAHDPREVRRHGAAEFPEDDGALPAEPRGAPRRQQRLPPGGAARARGQEDY